jgi:hypothetical protein
MTDNLKYFGIIILIIIILYIYWTNSENFSTSTEAINNISTMYNAGTLTATNLNITNQIKIGNTIIDASGNITNGNIRIDASGNITTGNIRIDASGNISTTGNIAGTTLNGNLTGDVTGNVTGRLYGSMWSPLKSYYIQVPNATEPGIVQGYDINGNKTRNV